MTKTEWLKTILTEPRFTFLCEILFWFNPQKSLAYLSLFNIFIHLIYFFTKNGIIYVTAYFLLFRLWKPIWTDRIWPHIQTAEFTLLSDWTTIDPSLPDYEISMNLIEEKLEKYFNRFVKMKMNVIQTFHSVYIHQSRAYLEFSLVKKFPEFISFIWHLFWSQLCRSFSEMKF